MSEDEIQSFGQVIDKSFSSIRMKDMGRAINIYDTWKSVLQKIYSERNPNEGKNMAAHSQVVDLKNGILLVEADHPGWIELLRLHKKFILNGMQKAIKDESIDTLAFRLSGSEKGLASVDTAYSPEKVREEIAKRIEKEDKILNESENKSKVQASDANLPQELALIFEDLRKSMLTNSKK